VRPQAGDLGAPADDLALHVVAIEPGLPAKEALAYVGDLSLHVWLALRMTGHGGVDHEATVTGVLREGALEGRVVAIRLGDGRFEVVQHHARRDPAEVRPRVLEALDQVRQRLRVCDVHVLVPAVHQRDDEGVQRTALADRRVGDEAQAAEVHLGQLARRHLRHPHGDPPLIAEAAELRRETMQRAVRNVDPLADQQLMDLGQTQAPTVVARGQPRPDLLAVRRQLPLALARGAVRRHRPHPPRHLPGQGLIGLLHQRRPAERRRRPHPAADRRAAVPAPAGDGPLALPAVNPP
jgi:hypothetical protein